MTTPKPANRIVAHSAISQCGAAVVALLLLTFTVSLIPAARAQAANTGTIEGRVFNPGTGEYLEKARVTVEGTALETLTDNLGQYWLTGVPAGSARVKVFFTGLAPQTANLTVGAGQSVQQDFNLAGFDQRGQPSTAPLQLEKLVVSSSREMDGAAIAINEKRFASDIRNVIAADEFGPMADGNVGEILKTIPGVALDYVGGAAMNISLEGVPSGYVPVTMNGFPLASTTASAPTGRDVELINVATNNLSRIEVLHSPTPESPGNALAGSVNMVPKGAFERVKPLLTTNVYVLMRDDVISLKKTPGPGQQKTYKVHPGFDFSYVAPVNKKFGFTLSGGTSQQYQPTYFVQANWRGVSVPTNGAAFPHTTADRPYLTDYLIRDQPRQSRRSSAGITLDYKLTSKDRISVSFQATKFDAQYSTRDLTFAITRVLPGNFSTSFTRGDRGAGTITHAHVNDRDRRNQSFSPSIIYRHDGPIWKAEAGAGWSMSTSKVRNMGKGYFANVGANRPNVTIAFDEIFYLRPGIITVTDGTTGAPVDPYKLSSYNITTAGGHRYGADTVVGTGPGEGIHNRTHDTQRNAYANVKRVFRWRVPVTLKAGLDVRQSIRDYRGGTTALTAFVGADGRAATGDENAALFYDPLYSSRDGVFGFPKIERIDPEKLWDVYQANPQSFTKNDNNIYRSAIQLSTWAQEIISSAYLRGDTTLLNHKLKLTGGVRAEQTNIKAQGPLTDITRNFQRRPDGTVIRNAAGQALTQFPTTSVEFSRLTFLERAAHAKKEYLRLFPSINASYSVRDNLIVRAAYYTSIGRPIYAQYAGGVSLPDESQAPSPNNFIQVSNVAIKPWSAETFKVSVEYYFERIGLFSVGAFRRDFENFFGQTRFAATPEFLALYELDPTQFGGFEVATQFNIPSTVRSEGYNVHYKQALTFLPQWARGVQVFVNGAAQRVVGALVNNFSGYIPKTATWGISLSRPTYNLKVNWNYKGRHRRAAINGASIPPGTYVFGSKRLFVDVIGEYKLTRNFAVFGNIRNLLDTPEDFVRDGPGIPDVAKFRQRDRYGALWIFGLKGTF